MTTNCYICGSNRIVEGPAYDRGAETCMDCGTQFGRTERTIPEPEEISVALSAEVPFPTGGFDSPEAAMEHLAKLKAAAAKLGKPVEKKVDRPSKKAVKEIPNAKLELKDDYPKEMVFIASHCYQRESEPWQAVLATAKGEREHRMDNVRVFAHNHIFGAACTTTCKEI